MSSLRDGARGGEVDILSLWWFDWSREDGSSTVEEE
jgi:hypothetical protein